ncbi:hypothetical protein ACIRPX_02475 [Streptomyces sp. NPDC101225]|uniref:hypothetical protein n=1 Tax=Streptomyces sp. NPDC101225 TaxID=3366135 RepID=UPI0037F6F133
MKTLLPVFPCAWVRRPEPERTKTAAITSAIRDALKRRQVNVETAELVAELATMALRSAFRRWMEAKGDADFADCLVTWWPTNCEPLSPGHERNATLEHVSWPEAWSSPHRREFTVFRTAPHPLGVAPHQQVHGLHRRGLGRNTETSRPVLPSAAGHASPEGCAAVACESAGAALNSAKTAVRT